MTHYPRERVDAIVRPVRFATAHRIVLRKFLSAPLEVQPGKSRFCDGGSYAVLYIADNFETAFIETVVRDRFVQADRRFISLDDVLSRGCVELRTEEPLQLVDLRDDGCLRLGAPTDAVHARNHAAGRALSRALHDGHSHVDGLWYRSRFTGTDCFAVFDRAVAKLAAVRTQDLVYHPELPAVAENHSIRLER